MTPATGTQSQALTGRLPRRRTVADAMVTEVKRHDARTTVREIRALFDDEHVQAAIIVGDGTLLAVVDRADLSPDGDENALAVHLGGRRGRVIAPDADLARAQQLMLDSGRRRLAVVDGAGKVCGLLCLKRTRSGFCSNRDVRARSARSRVQDQV
jgi:CBS domain-containing protein